MEQTLLNIESKNDLQFRVAKLSGLDALAIRSNISFDGFKKTLATYKMILEKIEIKCGETWIPVKEKDKEIYSPVGLEEDTELIEELCIEFINKFIKKVFQKSNASK